MAIAASFSRWEEQTHRYCCENMRRASRPMGWAVEKIKSTRHHPCTASRIAIELLRRLNLPLIYLVSEASLIYRIALDLIPAVKIVFQALRDYPLKWDEDLIKAAVSIGAVILRLASERVALLIHIIWQLLFGAVKIETAQDDPQSPTSRRRITSTQGALPTRKIAHLSKRNSKKAQKLIKTLTGENCRRSEPLPYTGPCASNLREILDDLPRQPQLPEKTAAQLFGQDQLQVPQRSDWARWRGEDPDHHFSEVGSTRDEEGTSISEPREKEPNQEALKARKGDDAFQGAPLSRAVDSKSEMANSQFPERATAPATPSPKAGLATAARGDGADHPFAMISDFSKFSPTERQEPFSISTPEPKAPALCRPASFDSPVKFCSSSPSGLAVRARSFEAKSRGKRTGR